MGGKQNVILVGPFVGEMFWEFFRFVPHIIGKIKHLVNCKVVVYTRKDRFDMYGQWANEFKPLVVPGDGETKFAECFHLMGQDVQEFEKIKNDFYNEYVLKYNILMHLYPPVKKKKDYLNKNYYPLNQQIFEYMPREDNVRLVTDFLYRSKVPVILAPRFRKNFKRNWKHWPVLYDLLSNNDFFKEKVDFIICGKSGEYIPDEKTRFKDINQIQQTENSSLIGLLMALMEKTFLTIGSQSAIPNISLLYEVPVIEWGNQRHEHTVLYNIKNTSVEFIDDFDFNIDPKIIYRQIEKTLRRML